MIRAHSFAEKMGWHKACIGLQKDAEDLEQKHSETFIQNKI